MIERPYGFVLCACLVALSGCAEPPKRSDLLIGDFLRTEDVQRVAGQMIAKLDKDTKLLKDRASPPTLALVAVQNNTVQYFFPSSKTRFVRTMREQLISKSAGKLAFVDLEREHEIREQFARDGGEQAARSASRRWGVDYLLSAVFDEKKGEVKAGKDKKRKGVYSFLLMTFTLTDAETGQVVWTDDFKIEEVIAVPPWVAGG